MVAAVVSPPPRHRLLRPPPPSRCLLRPPSTVAASFTHRPRSPPCLHHSRSGSSPPSRLHNARSESYRAKDEDNAGARTIGERGTTPLPNAIDKPLRPSPLISGRRRASTSPTLPLTVPATMNSGAPDPDTLNSEVADPTIPSLGALDLALLASATPDPFVR
ncbi:Os01g0862900 [Oryza sativa Japonica Group]|uniref:Os01g0862900 protein n=1 Tax=Oryza sativa subsp. japonica TaxID=39947 RepID=A0A0P0VAM8_ORYSJ|nr:Os01g0862900 [Oryza sativa Japonica Group]